MKKLKELLMVCLLAAPLVLTNCGNNGGGSSSSGGGSNLFIPIIDLAVTDFDFATDGFAFEQPAVYLYFDVLNDLAGGLQDPDVTLDFTNSGLDWPRHPYFSGDDLYLGTGNGSTGMHVYRDYRTVPDGATPDFTLSDNGGGAGTWGDTHGFWIVNGKLFANFFSGSQILTFNGILSKSVAAQRRTVSSPF